MYLIKVYYFFLKHLLCDKYLAKYKANDSYVVPIMHLALYL